MNKNKKPKTNVKRRITRIKNLEESILSRLQLDDGDLMEILQMEEAISLLIPPVERIRKSRPEDQGCGSERMLEDTLRRKFLEAEQTINQSDLFPNVIHRFNHLMPLVVEMTCVFQERSHSKIQIDPELLDWECVPLVLSRLRSGILEVLNGVVDFYSNEILLESVMETDGNGVLLKWPVSFQYSPTQLMATAEFN